MMHGPINVRTIILLLVPIPLLQKVNLSQLCMLSLKGNVI